MPCLGSFFVLLGNMVQTLNFALIKGRSWKISEIHFLRELSLWKKIEWYRFLKMKQYIYLIISLGAFEHLIWPKQNCIFFGMRYWKKYGERVKGIYTDTDYYIVSLESDDNFTELKDGPLSEWTHFPNFDPNHPLCNNTRKGELGLSKSEVGKTMMSEAIYLKPELCSLLLDSDRKMLTGKETPVNERAKMNHNEYGEKLLGNHSRYIHTSSITSRKGQLSTVKIKKRGLSINIKIPSLLEPLAMGEKRRRNFEELPMSPEKNQEVLQLTLNVQINPCINA